MVSAAVTSSAAQWSRTGGVALISWPETPVVPFFFGGQVPPLRFGSSSAAPAIGENLSQGPRKAAGLVGDYESNRDFRGHGGGGSLQSRVDRSGFDRSSHAEVSKDSGAGKHRTRTNSFNILAFLPPATQRSCIFVRLCSIPHFKPNITLFGGRHKSRDFGVASLNSTTINNIDRCAYFYSNFQETRP